MFVRKPESLHHFACVSLVSLAYEGGGIADYEEVRNEDEEGNMKETNGPREERISKGRAPECHLYGDLNHLMK
jgi:hypothetical protein